MYSRSRCNPMTYTAALAFIVFMCAVLCACGRAARTGVPDYAADVADICRAFLVSCGWVPADVPCEVSEIRIPVRFGAVFSEYNRLQKAQGFDLSAYKGKTATKVVFPLLNYPGADDNGPVNATVLSIDARIIGGDISCARLNGFMHGFHMEEIGYGNNPPG